jgi:methyl-accepting chemotaxis protein
MATIIGTGSSTHDSPKEAALEAARNAMVRLQGVTPAYGCVFAAPGRDLAAAMAGVRQAAGPVELVGCTTAGEITEQGLIHGGVAVLLVASDDSSATACLADGLRSKPALVAQQLHAATSAQRKAAASRGMRQTTTVVLTDGLAGTGEKVVIDLHDRGQSGSQIVGGAAGDEGMFKATQVAAGEIASADAAVCLHVCSERRWGVGVNHGLRPTTKPMRVTRATGNVVYELDGEPAIQAYERHAAARGIKLTAANTSPYLIANELGIHFFDTITRARAPLSAGSDGSLSCAADIPKGSMVSILDGDPVCMVDAARAAAEEAKEHLDGAQAAGVLLFDCVCRGMILKDGFNREVDAVRSVFGSIPVAGFLTYGEIARYQGSLDGWHNATAVVVAIPK